MYRVRHLPILMRHRWLLVGAHELDVVVRELPEIDWCVLTLSGGAIAPSTMLDGWEHV